MDFHALTHLLQIDHETLRNVMEFFNINEKTTFTENVDFILSGVVAGGWVGVTSGGINPNHPLYGTHHRGSGTASTTNSDHFDERMNDLYNGKIPEPHLNLSDVIN